MYASGHRKHWVGYPGTWGSTLLTRTSSRQRLFIFNPNEEKYTASVRALLTEQQAGAPAVAKRPLRRYQPCQSTGPQARTVSSVRQVEQVGGGNTSYRFNVNHKSISFWKTKHLRVIEKRHFSKLYIVLTLRGAGWCFLGKAKIIGWPEFTHSISFIFTFKNQHVLKKIKIPYLKVQK